MSMVHLKKRSMAVVGSVLVGCAALGLGIAAAGSASAATTSTTINGAGPTEYDAYMDAESRCVAGGGKVGQGAKKVIKNDDGTWNVQIQCEYET